MSTTDWITVGRFGRPHGVKGLITVISFTEPLENLIDYVPWHLCSKEGVWVPLTLLNVQSTNKGLIAEIEGYSDRDSVGALTNQLIAVSKECFPALKKGEYYWHQLVGMTVVNRENLTLGSVSDILSTGANDVLVVMGETKHLIPYVLERFVLAIDDEKQIIHVDWDGEFD